MRKASDFMEETLDDMLNLQKIEEGKFELYLGPTSIREIFDNLTAVFSGGLTAKQITLIVNIEPTVPLSINCDGHRMQHVAANLLSNAIKFSPPKGSTITVDIGPKHNPNGGPTLLEVAITDQGCGVSEEAQRGLFTSFVQIKPNTLQQGKGSGLGLAFCKEIVKMHNGSIGVKSAEGAGSTFYFRIPLEEVENIAQEAPSEHQSHRVGDQHSLAERHTNELPADKSVEVCTLDRRSPVSEATVTVIAGSESGSESADVSKVVGAEESGSFPRVLVADDFLANRKMLGMILSKVGVRDIDYAENGAIVVDMVLANPEQYQLILMDNVMPEVFPF